MPIKHKAKLSALLASRQHTECFILHIARARPYFNCFKELTHECLVKAYLFQSITRPSTSSSQVRRFWMISYANAWVSRLILAELTWYAIFFHCLQYIFHILPCCIAIYHPSQSFLIYRPDHTDQIRPPILKYRPTTPDHATFTCADRNNNKPVWDARKCTGMQPSKLRSYRQILTARSAKDHACHVGGITGTICEERAYLPN